MSETNRIEYKRELNIDVDIEKEVIAFLNYHEGDMIYVGIDKTGKVIGVTDLDGDTLKIKDRIKNNISPSAMGLFDVVIEEWESKAKRLLKSSWPAAAKSLTSKRKRDVR